IIAFPTVGDAELVLRSTNNRSRMEEAADGDKGTGLVAGVSISRCLDQLRAGNHLGRAQAHLAATSEVSLLHGSIAVGAHPCEVLHAGYQRIGDHVPEVYVVVRACNAAHESGIGIGELEL